MERRADERSSEASGALPSGAAPGGSAWRGRLIPEVLGAVVLFHLCALLAFTPYLFSWTGVVVAVVASQVFGVVMAVGYHRYFAHRCFSCSRGFAYLLAVLGLLCVQRGPAWWAATHRRHHHHADSDLDPHNPRPSFLWAHLGWFMFVNDNTDRKVLHRYAGDWMKDPFFAWIETGSGWILFTVAFALILFGAGASAELLTGGAVAEAVRLGLSLVFWGVFVRTVVVWHVTWSSASCSHLFGYRNYEIGDDSRNNWVLTLLLVGEGWANNHHAFPSSPRLTVRWWEVDLGWLIIKGLARVGLVTVDPASFPPQWEGPEVTDSPPPAAFGAPPPP